MTTALLLLSGGACIVCGAAALHFRETAWAVGLFVAGAVLLGWVV